MPILDHFGLLAPLYETFIPPGEPKELISFADLPASGAVLDAGGGTGRLSQYLRGLAHPIVVADLSCRMLAEARQKEGLSPVCSHTEILPFADHTFARIIMVDALHHVCDQTKTAAELYRILKPGGVLVIQEPDIRIFSIKLIALAEKLALMRSHFLSAERITALFADLNAKVSVEAGNHNVYVVVRK